jgi:pyruvate,water dikinase
MYRAMARAARSRPAGRADDVLYLTTAEIDAYWRGTATSLDLRTLTRGRRREFAAFESIDAPNRIITTGSPHECAAASVHGMVPASAERNELHNANARILRGLGCSAGVAQGRVRIVSSASSNLSLSGHILVATRTDPGWAPLFPSAAAILVERGSVLSHSAVLARELGLPAVVGIPGLTRALRDGELVRVDGTAGTIERLEAP